MKLNQIIAVEKTVKQRTNDFVTEIYKGVQQPALFDGFVRTYRPLEAEGEKLAGEQRKVQWSAPNVLRQVGKAMTDLIDITATKDFGNLVATADVKFGDQVLISGAPVTFLLFLEKQLTDLYTMVSKVPVLDPAEDWTYDENASQFRTQPVSSIRTKKLQRPLVMYPATDKHAAQTQLITEDINVGTWEQVKFSGALPLPVRQRILARIEALQKAVKFAREEANSVVVTQHSVGETLFKFLFAD
jgi:hypothetical protein